MLYEGEVWEDIEGYAGMYQISNHGRARSCSRYTFREGRGGELHSLYYPAKFLSFSYNGSYKYVNLKGPSGHKLRSVHRLVAETFLPNPEALPCVNHKDELKVNNKYTNLEWCTHSQNNIHSSKGVSLKSPEGVLVRFTTWDEAVTSLPFSRATLYRILKGQPVRCGWSKT